MKRRSLLAAIGGLLFLPVPVAVAARPPEAPCGRALGRGIVGDFIVGEVKVCSHLPAGSVRADQIAVGAVTCERIGVDTIRDDRLQANAISAKKIIVSKEKN